MISADNASGETGSRRYEHWTTVLHHIPIKRQLTKLGVYDPNPQQTTIENSG
jgi:hypothetical protein